MASSAAMTARVRAPAAVAVPWLTGAIAPGVSIAVNRDHAPCQPSVVSGHHSIDCGRGAFAGQIP
jgi:hypothetical protein